MRFFLIDRITNIVEGEIIEGIKCWSLTDEIFQDHFPGNPVVPCAFLIESMAQLLGILIEKTYEKGDSAIGKVFPIITNIHHAKFRRMVVPGDQCILKGRLTSADHRRANGKAEVYVENMLMADAVLSFAVFMKEDIPDNQWSSRRDEYLHVITRKLHGNSKGDV